MLADTVDHPGGIGRYVREVLGALGGRDDVRLAVLTTSGGSATVTRLAASTLDSLIVSPRADQISLALWGRYRSGAAFARAGAEVIVGAKHLIPRTSRPTVLVVHDLLTITRAHENALAKRILLPRQYRRSLTDADRLVAVSAATRARLGEINRSWEAKCSIVPNGMSARLIDVEPERPAAVGSQPFALVVGDLSPRKNLALLTRLWATAPPEDLRLVVVGPDSGTDAPVRRELLALERAGRVFWIRDAEDPVLRWCYEQARVVLFPTFEEGFGLPLLEAMTFHAPVVASTDLALFEVSAGDPRVVHVDPYDHDAWRTAIKNALVAGRTPRSPQLPDGAITWREHTDRLISIARELARGTPSPRTTS